MLRNVLLTILAVPVLFVGLAVLVVGLGLGGFAAFPVILVALVVVAARRRRR